MIMAERWFIGGPSCITKGARQWEGRCLVDDATPGQYIYYPRWPDRNRQVSQGAFTTVPGHLKDLIARGSWIEIDQDLEMDEGL
jgi:hypothetical protein